MSPLHTGQMDPLTCPGCECKLDAYQNPDPNARPGIGSYHICLECGIVSQRTIVGLRRLTDAEVRHCGKTDDGFAQSYVAVRLSLEVRFPTACTLCKTHRGTVTILLWGEDGSDYHEVQWCKPCMFGARNDLATTAPTCAGCAARLADIQGVLGGYAAVTADPYSAESVQFRGVSVPHAPDCPAAAE